MKDNIKFILISLIVLNLICCTALQPPSSPKKDEYQESLDEFDRLLEQREKQNQELMETLKTGLDNLRLECLSVIWVKMEIDKKLSHYNRHEAILLNQLNDNQLELYSKWIDSINGDNLSRLMLYTRKLKDSLNKEQYASFLNLYDELISNTKEKTDFEQSVAGFENRKNKFLNGIKLLYPDDPTFHKTFKLIIENELTY
jgi:hypothetical protein